MYQPAFVGKDDGLGSVAQMKFGEDAFEVGLDGVLAKEQRAATSPLESPRATSTRISCSR